jgi:hypothetical protein
MKLPSVEPAPLSWRGSFLYPVASFLVGLGEATARFTTPLPLAKPSAG